MKSRYADDPLVQARHTHVRLYQGHPDGSCCVTCETNAGDGGKHEHVTWPCQVVDNETRCEYAFEPYRCIQTKHEGDRHLVESPAGQRMVMWPDD